MNEEQKQRLIMNIINFYVLFRKEMLELFLENNSELSPLQFIAIHEIYTSENITPSLLSKRLSITIPNTSRCLHSLVDLGYAVKVKDQSDKRVTHIILSQKGLDLIQHSRELMDKALLRKLGVLETFDLEKLSETFSVLGNLS